MRMYLIFSLLGFLLIGCAEQSSFGVKAENQSVLVSTVYKAVDALIAGQTKSPMITDGGGSRVLVATVANLNDLDTSSGFGMLISEQVGSRLAQRGVPVGEAKFTGKLFVSKNEGELVLSREMKEISSSLKADLLIVGSYVEAGDFVYVTLKIVRASDSEISNAYNFVIPKNSNIEFMLKRKTR
jgi:hypothetical protein